MITEQKGYPASREAINRTADRLEAELRRLGAWSDTPLPPEKMQFTRPFGGDTMAFEQWIQFILVVRLRDIAASGGRMPPSSDLAAYAVREFDGHEDEMATLIDLLRDVDALCPPRRHVGYGAFPHPRLGPALLFLVLALGWAAASLYAANDIAGRIAAYQPARVLAYSHYMGRSESPWNGLTIQAWAWESNETLRAYEANLALPARPRSSGPTPLAFSIDIDFDASPAAIKLPRGDKLALSAAEVAHWAYGEAAQSAAAAADPIPQSLFELLDGLKQGVPAKVVEDSLGKIGSVIGDSSVQPEIKRYPPTAGTGLFVGVFCAIFMPPMLVWMVWQYRRNLARLRAMP